MERKTGHRTTTPRSSAPLPAEQETLRPGERRHLCACRGMSLSAESVFSALLEEKHLVHKLYEEKIKHAWTVLILALSIPVAAGTLQVTPGAGVGAATRVPIEFLNLRFIVLGGCLVGNAVLAYAFWVYREVYAYECYLRKLEERLHNLVGAELVAWESHFNPYRQHQRAVGVVFTTLILAMVVASILSVLYGVEVIGKNIGQPALPWYLVAPIAVAFVGLFTAIALFIRGLAPVLHEKASNPALQETREKAARP